MSDHIDDATFEKLAMRELSEDDRETALSHVRTCGQCAAIYKVLLGVEDGAQKAGLYDDKPRRSRWWIGAGVAVAAAAAIVLWLSQRPPDSQVVRGSGDRAIMLSSPSGDVRGPVTFSWEAAPATVYRIDVFTPDGHPVWTRNTTETSIAWPSDVPQTAGEYQWLVAAFDGHVVRSESGVVTFRIVP